VQTPGVVPVHPAERGQLEVLDGLPRLLPQGLRINSALWWPFTVSARALPNESGSPSNRASSSAIPTTPLPLRHPRRADAQSAASPCPSPGRQGCMYPPPAVDLSPATAGGFVPPVLPITGQKVSSAQEVLGASGNSTSARSMRRQPAHRTIAMIRAVGSEPARGGV
jgi:hypothetical protein